MPTVDGKPIQAKVARILNSRELILNRGEDAGVLRGMKFAILDPKAENVKDPESGEVLGSVYRPKVEVQVTVVEERLSVARTFRSTRVNLGGQGFGSGLTDPFRPPKWVDRPQTFRTDEETWETLSEAESFVKTGDLAKEIVEYTDEDESSSVGLGPATDRVDAEED
jgi:hypothetical protein